VLTRNEDGESLIYRSHANYCGPDSFTYTLVGGSTARGSINVTCIDDAPVAVDDAATVDEDAPMSSLAVFANDPDVDGGPKTVTSFGLPAHGEVTQMADQSSIGYTPAADYCGPDSFTYTLSGRSTATVSIDVNCLEDAPPSALPPSADTAPPQTQITSQPMKLIKTRAASVLVRFRFSSTEPGSRFFCRMDSLPLHPCGSPRTYRVRVGKHVFRVGAADSSGNWDPTPATFNLRVWRRRH
jgi:hypothetical protein